MEETKVHRLIYSLLQLEFKTLVFFSVHLVAALDVVMFLLHYVILGEHVLSSVK